MLCSVWGADLTVFTSNLVLSWSDEVFPGLPQGLAGLLNLSHVFLSMRAITVLQSMIFLPMAAGSNLNSGELMFDKRVCTSFQKNTAVMGGLLKCGVLTAGEDFNTPKGQLAFGAAGLVNLVLIPLKPRLLGWRVMPAWSSMRWV